MIKHAYSQPDSLLAWMDCLADPTRLRLLRLLERHELGVVDLIDIVQAPQSTVSRHLKVLADQGFVKSRREGTNHLYRTLLDELDPAARKLWLLTREQSEGWAAFKADELRLSRRLKERESESQSFFAGAAREWDQLREELYGHQFTTSAMLALLSSDLVVADLGCGTGQLASELAGYVKQIIAVDNSPAMLKAAQKRTETLNNVQVRRGDLASLPIDSQSCDATFFVLALVYVADPAAALKESARILRKGGKLIIVDLMHHHREDFRRQFGQQRLGFDSRDLDQLLSQSGFNSTQYQPLKPEADVKGPPLFMATALRAEKAAL